MHCLFLEHQVSISSQIAFYGKYFNIKSLFKQLYYSIASIYKEYNSSIILGPSLTKLLNIDLLLRHHTLSYHIDLFHFLAVIMFILKLIAILGNPPAQNPLTLDQKEKWWFRITKNVTYSFHFVGCRYNFYRNILFFINRRLNYLYFESKK